MAFQSAVVGYPGCLLIELELEQHPVIPGVLVIQQVNVTGLRHDVTGAGELRRGWVNSESVLELARTQVGDSARHRGGIENDLSGVARSSRTEVVSWAETDDGVTREAHLVPVTRSFPFGRCRDGGGRVELDRSLCFLVSQPEDQVVDVGTPVSGFCSSAGSGFILAANSIASFLASSDFPCRKRLIAR